MKKIVLVTILFICFLIQGINTPTASSNRVEEKITLDSDYITHEAISIHSNDDFIEYGFSGSGTKTNPYIIEGYNITVSWGHCINIFSVSKYFVVRDCLLETTDEYDNACIRLANSGGYGTIVNNICSGYSGVNVWDYCTSVNITGNYFHNSGIGIKIKDSSNCLIWKNIVEDSRYGFMITDSQSCTIKNNTIISNEDEGIYLNRASNTHILYNYISNNDRGIKSSSSTNSIIHHNTLRNNYVGIYLNNIHTGETPTIDNLIHHNNFIDNIARPQAFDYSEGGLAIWYEVATNEGNYWSNYNGSGVYQIEYNPDFYLGVLDIHDPYPLSSPVSISEFTETSPPPDDSGDDSDNAGTSFLHVNILFTFLTVFVMVKFVNRKKH